MDTSYEDLSAVSQLLTAGRFEQAEAACRRILQSQPDHEDALLLLGQSLSQQGRYSEALVVLHQLLGVRTGDAGLLAMLGDIYMANKQTVEAISHYRRALTLDANDAVTHNNLGVSLKEQGLLAEALESFRTAVRLRPDLTYGHKNLGEILYLREEWDRAQVHYQHAIQLDPQDPAARSGLGLVLSAQGKYGEAIAQYEEAIRLQPGDAAVENNLADALRRVGRVDEAVRHSRKSLQVKPDLAVAHVTLGAALKTQGKLEAALAEFQNALELDAGRLDARVQIGWTLIDLGQFDRAVEHLEKVLEIDPDNALALANLGNLALENRYDFSDERLDRINALLAAGEAPSEDIGQLLFVMGDMMERRGEYERAFGYFRDANHTMYELAQKANCVFDANECRRYADAMIAAYDPTFFQQACSSGLDTDVPVFVVGMPRSGTTLVHQILASHPEVDGAGEMPEIANLTNELSTLLDVADKFPHDVGHAGGPILRQIAERYLKCLADRGCHGRRIVDKTPGNFLFLGFIVSLFPRARLIHCRRDAMDVCASCYTKSFKAVSWSLRCQDIAAFYRQYERLMAHWREVLPVPVYDVAYEQLVAEPERISRELITHCGLDWNDACLDFHNNGGAVQTASRVQVRQPIYNTSIGRWMRFEKQFAPLRRALNDPDD